MYRISRGGIRAHGGNIGKLAQEYGVDPRDVLDFSANINPLGPSEKVLRAIVENLSAIASYPDPDCRVLREEISHVAGAPSENIIIGNGASELIYLIVNALRPREALVPSPTFSEYEFAVESIGGQVRRVWLPREEGFVFKPHEALRRMGGATLIFLCNPNNPTGRLYPMDELLTIIDWARRKGVFVVIDESFIDFCGEKRVFDFHGEKRVSIEFGDGPHSREAPNLEASNLFILRSFTKFFAIPGLRLGYGIGSRELIERLSTLRDPWSVNSLAQVAGVEALRDIEYLAKTCELIKTERRFLYEALKSIPGLEPYPSHANFILVNIASKIMTVADVCRVLGKKGIFIRDCSNFPGLDDYHFRVAVRNRAENERLVAALADALPRPRNNAHPDRES